MGVIAVLVIVASAGCTDAKSHRGTKTPSAAPSASCKLAVTETGFTPRKAYLSGQHVPTDDALRVGILVQNRCPDAAMDVHITAYGVDGSGRRLVNPLHTSSKIQATADVPLIMPGETVAVSAGAGTTDSRGDTRSAFGKIAQFSATARPGCWGEPGDEYKPMPTTSGTKVGPTDADGHDADRYANVSFRLTPAKTAGPTRAAAVFRDRAGRLIDVEEGSGTYSTASPSPGHSVITVWLPPNAVASRTRVVVRPEPRNPPSC